MMRAAASPNESPSRGNRTASLGFNKESENLVTGWWTRLPAGPR